MFDCDVAIVGYGPVGQVLGALLASQGHRVLIIERFAQVYPLPRAIRFDGEVMRIFQRLGIVDEITPELVPGGRYRWFGADGELILDLDRSQLHPSGWRSDYAFYQPHIEAALDRAARNQPSLDLWTGWQCEGFHQAADHVEVTIRRGGEPAPGRFEPSDDTRTITARYLVGADGARSVVRASAGIDELDLGFSQHWLVCDLRPNDMLEFEHLPAAAQYCEPARPHVAVKNGAHHRRWEFMLLPGEDPAAYAGDPQLTWQLLEPYMRPDQGHLVRFAVYEFRSIHALAMRAGRALLAGDAAHRMPPFMGEGMCAGLRDANNLAWRLDLVLREIAGEDLLDSYTPERRHQNEVTISISVEMGKVACTIDPGEAAARDAALRSGQVPPPPDLPGIGGDGLVNHDEDPLAGEKAVQGTIDKDGRSGRFDDVLGPGFALILRSGDPESILGAERMRYLTQDLHGAVVSLDPQTPGGVRDLDGRLTAWLDDTGRGAILSRPDAYVFGSAPEASAGAALLDVLREAIAPSVGATR